MVPSVSAPWIHELQGEVDVALPQVPWALERLLDGRDVSAGIIVFRGRGPAGPRHLAMTVNRMVSGTSPAGAPPGGSIPLQFPHRLPRQLGTSPPGSSGVPGPSAPRRGGSLAADRSGRPSWVYASTHSPPLGTRRRLPGCPGPFPEPPPSGSVQHSSDVQGASCTD
jgi:hypothetical protein